MASERQFIALASATASISATLSALVSYQVTLTSKLLNLVPPEDFTESKDEVMTELRSVVQKMDDVYKAVAFLRERLDEFKDESNGPS